MTEAHRFIFVGGMHRSGTSPLARLIGSHPAVSMFSNTGVPEDEGQYLQDIYPKERDLGGVGAFGHHPEAHLDETWPFIEQARTELFDSWRGHWDLGRRYLLEKTPINFIRGRLLQEIFPESFFVFIIRHPITTCMATLKWANRLSLVDLFEHWIKCYRYMIEDIAHMRNVILIRYEDICENGESVTQSIQRFLGLEQPLEDSEFNSQSDGAYFRQWEAGDYRIWTPDRRVHSWAKRNFWNRVERMLVETRYEKAINEFGYTFGGLHSLPGKTSRREPDAAFGPETPRHVGAK